MDTIVVTLHNRHGDTEFAERDSIRVELKESDSDWRGPDEVRDGSSYFSLKRVERPLPVELRVTPGGTPLYWACQKRFLYLGDGDLAKLVEPDPSNDDYVDTNFVSAADAHGLFFAEQSLRQGRNAVVTVGAIATKVRNVLPRAQRNVLQVPDYRREVVPDTYTLPKGYRPTWTLPPRHNLSVVGLPVVNRNSQTPTEGNVHIIGATVEPDMSETVLEVRERLVPQLFSVSVPTHLLSADAFREQPSLPFHVHYRPYSRGAGYFDSRPGFTSYPFDWDYLFFCLWGERTYVQDPFHRPKVGKGYCYQIAHSGKAVALALPCPHRSTFGKAVEDPAWLDDMLIEIQAYVFRQLRLLWPGRRPGRTSVSGLSAGNEAMAQLLEKANGEHAIRESYILDAPDGSANKTLSTIASWATRVDDSRIRAYSRYSTAAYLNPVYGLSEVSEVGDPVGPPRSYVRLPPERWRTPFQERGDLALLSQGNVHQLIGGQMLADALRRSGLP